MKYTIRLKKYRANRKIRTGFIWRYLRLALKYYKLAILGIVVLVISILGGKYLYQQKVENRYIFKNNAGNLLEESNEKLAKAITYNGQTNSYTLGENKKPDTSNLPEDVPQSVKDELTKTDSKLPFQIDISRDFKNGFSVTDKDMNLSVKMLPLFDAYKARKDDVGYITFPLKKMDGAQLVHTVTSTGLKEDIVLYKPAQKAEFKYKLELPDYLEARVEENGSIGIYSADPALFGDISYGQDADREKIQKARENNKKTNLVFTIPAPVIYEQNGRGGRQVVEVSDVQYALAGDELTIVGNGMDKLHFPISIDPTIVVTSTNDFYKLNNEYAANTATNGEIKRSSMNGAELWDTQYEVTSDLAQNRQKSCGLVYNNYFYVLGGDNRIDIEYIEIASDGSLTGNWTTNANDLPYTTEALDIACAEYNGYLYVIGGYDNGSSKFKETYNAKVNSDGSLSSWTDTGYNLTYDRQSATARTYKGYLYIVAGRSTCIGSKTVEYAKLNSDGTTGAWQTTTTMVYQRLNSGVVIYDGYIFATGGWYYASACTGATMSGTSESAKIKSDGSLESWNTINSMNNTRRGHGAVAMDGYLYSILGDRNVGLLDDYEYAPILPGGKIGTWTTVDNNWSGHSISAQAYRNGYVYMAGAWTSATRYKEASYFKLKSHGAVGAYSNTTLSSARKDSATVTYKDCVYIIGGINSSGSRTQNIYYATLNDNGSFGTWTDSSTNLSNMTSAPTNGLSGMAVAVFNDRLYIVGGTHNDGSPAARTVVESIRVQDEQCGFTGSWSSNTALPSARTEHGAVVHGDRIIVVGGSDGTNPQSTVYYSDALSKDETSGTFTNWNTATNVALNTARDNHTVVYGNGYVYAIGGHDGTNRLASVEVASASNIITNNASGDWASTTALPVSRSHHGSVIEDGVIYASGGKKDSGGTRSTDLLFAQIKSDGTIGDWVTDTNGGAVSFTTARDAHAMASHNSRIYIMGGDDGTSAINDIRYSALLNSTQGTNNAWSSTTSLGAGNELVRYCSVTYTGTSSTYLYVIGGRRTDTGSRLTEVRKNTFNSDGTIGTWVTSPDSGNLDVLPTALSDHSCAVYGNYVYVLGGNDATSRVSSVSYATLTASNGNLDNWTSADGIDTNDDGDATDNDDKRDKLGVVAYNGYMYVIGGETETSGSSIATVNYIDINTDGTLGDTGNNDWAATSSLGTARRDHAVAFGNGYLYALGGYSNTYSLKIRTVEYAQFNSNGTLSSWAFTNDIPEQISNAEAVFNNGYLYLVGGSYQGGTTLINEVISAPIYQNGMIGKWNMEDTNVISNARENHTVVTNNSYLYIIGGWDTSTNYYSDVQYAQLVTSPRTAAFSKTVYYTESDATDDNQYVKFVDEMYNGTDLANETLTISYDTSCNATLDYGSLTNFSTPSAGTANSINTTGKSLYLFYSLDYSNGAAFPLSSTVFTDISINYYLKTETAVFMRHGKWFAGDKTKRLIPDNAEQPFDTSPDNSAYTCTT